MKTTFTALCLISLLLLSSALASPANIAIIVNKANPTDELSSTDLVKIFAQDKQYWENGKKVYLIMQEAGSLEKKVILKKIYKMGDEELKRFWLAKMFREEIASFPKTLSSNEAVKRFISQVPNAIGFIDASFVDESVKVLRIDKKLPGEKGYVLGEPSS